MTIYLKTKDQEYPMCLFCDRVSKYDQPDRHSGVMISVCERHFTMDLSS